MFPVHLFVLLDFLSGARYARSELVRLGEKPYNLAILNFISPFSFLPLLLPPSLFFLPLPPSPFFLPFFQSPAYLQGAVHRFYRGV